MKLTSRIPISRINQVLVATFVVGAAATALAGNWFGALLLFLCGAGGLACAVYVRRPESLDINRLNAMEYRDERDRVLARHGFAAVGVAALILSVIEFVAAVVLDRSLSLAMVQVCLLTAVWSVANSRAVKRS
ncbi:hypothetical protein [Arthrobacter sp. A2-55]|uniref:hypothetical protein n=1 Tax=Arthrobacter sp. A2-55 TaxID=2897337 RepID=UPI0021CD6236|nr:hypothetical protein [Arthrobacter sp. A2-55]MCU6480106.1 hypothetical protein [Arthrobacter sp. A2-55]